MMRANPPLKPEILTAIPTILTDKNPKPQLQATLKTPYQLIDTAFNLETALQPFQQAKIIGMLGFLLYGKCDRHERTRDNILCKDSGQKKLQWRHLVK